MYLMIWLRSLATDMAPPTAPHSRQTAVQQQADIQPEDQLALLLCLLVIRRRDGLETIAAAEEGSQCRHADRSVTEWIDQEARVVRMRVAGLWGQPLRAHDLIYLSATRTRACDVADKRIDLAGQTSEREALL